MTASRSKSQDLFACFSYRPTGCITTCIPSPDGRLIVVGGIGPDDMAPWLAAGADGFGLGSGIYRPGQTPPATLAKAHAYQTALKSQ